MYHCQSVITQQCLFIYLVLKDLCGIHPETKTNELDDETLIKEANITFSIYDNSNNLVKKITTNDNGQAKIELTYGKYKIVQENTTLGYKKVKDFYIEINSNENKIINLENEAEKFLEYMKKEEVPHYVNVD